MLRQLLAVPLIGAMIGCASDPLGPVTSATSEPVALSAGPWGPETPNFNLEVILRPVGNGNGFGLVKFRQPNDDASLNYLDTWVRDLAPNTSYRLERAVDTNIDDNCTSTAWLTLGKGLTPQAIVTDASGTAREELFRAIPLNVFPAGSEFDIHFRLIRDGTSEVVLQSECYQFIISL
jgi:hypothetical protein